MIQSLDDLNRYLLADKKMLGIQYDKPRFFTDEVWRFEIALRKAEYALNVNRGRLSENYPHGYN